ncbi:MAG: ribonuclease P protein component [Bacteroidetes bacterium]|nr:ribonuclease P protein component [Bacteroidota bacterium]MDA1119184.1 ribonuclease P protein component [Bacteroidota bacterium]
MKNEASVPDFKFPKSEKLRLKNLIESLFKEGKSFFIYPFKVLHLLAPVEHSGNQVLITVSSKKFKKATDRNKIKRRIREAYRLNKYDLTKKLNNNCHLLIGYLYVGDEILDFGVIETKLKKTLERLYSEYQ